MSFYVTLPSNASQADYENKTKTNFKTKLKLPVYLEGNYEVALVEFMYPVSWKYRKDGRISISIDELIIDYTIEFYIYESLPEMMKRINDDFNLMQIVCSISYDPITRRIYLFIPPEVVFTFFDEVHLTLGFTKTIYRGTQNKNSNIRAPYISEIVKLNISELGNFYIYSDIVEYQYVGNEQTPLLRIVPTGDVVKEMNFTSKIYDSNHYIPVARNNIDTIEIDIRNHLGDPVNFTKGEVVVKLHFKRKSFY
jgi:hypothetical protein